MRRMRTGVPVLIVVAGACTVSGAASAQMPTLRTLAFMSGCWRGEPDARGTVIEESYTTPSTNLILGTTRYLRDGRTVSFEFTRIERSEDGVITLTPHPNGTASVAFRLDQVELPPRAVFQNREHDFPNRIIYRRDGDALVARIEGNDGRSREWRMTPCH